MIHEILSGKELNQYGVEVSDEINHKINRTKPIGWNRLASRYVSVNDEVKIDELIQKVLAKKTTVEEFIGDNDSCVGSHIYLMRGEERRLPGETDAGLTVEECGEPTVLIKERTDEITQCKLEILKLNARIKAIEDKKNKDKPKIGSVVEMDWNRREKEIYIRQAESTMPVRTKKEYPKILNEYQKNHTAYMLKNKLDKITAVRRKNHSIKFCEKTSEEKKLMEENKNKPTQDSKTYLDSLCSKINDINKGEKEPKCTTSTIGEGWNTVYVDINDRRFINKEDKQVVELR